MTALAIFVKTPGRSPLKTRLAATIGITAAEAFYRLAVEAVAEIAAAAAVTPYWAVAEPDAQHLWPGFPTIAQGGGGLGDRLDHVYATLLERHGAVALIGADSPQLTAKLLTVETTTPFTMGRAHDGGFWLFGGTAPIPAEIWRRVAYSRADTADALLDALRPLGETSFLPTLDDVDHEADLDRLARALDALPEPVPAQRRLSAWLAARQG